MRDLLELTSDDVKIGDIFIMIMIAIDSIQFVIGLDLINELDINSLDDTSCIQLISKKFKWGSLIVIVLKLSILLAWIFHFKPF